MTFPETYVRNMVFHLRGSYVSRRLIGGVLLWPVLYDMLATGLQPAT